MNPELDHLFWLRRWDASRRLLKHDPRRGIGKMAAMNQMIYMTSVFSWFMDNWEVANAKGENN
jgi:hypothetical protein